MAFTNREVIVNDAIREALANETEKTEWGFPRIFAYEIPGFGCSYPVYSSCGSPLCLFGASLVLCGWTNPRDSKTLNGAALPPAGVVRADGDGWYVGGVDLGNDPTPDSVIAAVRSMAARLRAAQAVELAGVRHMRLAKVLAYCKYIVRRAQCKFLALRTA